ncbi:MAG: RecQ family ATP-dependent DNA helicase [Elusimicrobia bacterium]|nr:RecQ family ATP-dependent DNA helicase [Elusimicrobiota bacterium]
MGDAGPAWEEVLRRRWGHAAFRPLQREAVAAALAGRDSLVVLPTGAGKSLCYQLPAALGRGLVLVVSPLIALMDEQVAAARKAGLAADALHSGLPDGRRGEARRRLESGRTELLYLSPERLLAANLLPRLGPRLGLVAVDEAHCISHWGHEFRPEYRRLAPVLRCCPGAARMALTATAAPAVRDDICAQLELRGPARLIGHPDRPNLVYRVLPGRDRPAQALEVARRHPGAGGLVYARTRAGAERLAAVLRQAGVCCAAYHAGLPAEERRCVHADFAAGRLDVVAATVAFGMGIDRPDIRYVVHADAPPSLDHYQQESGRAGRDGRPAECVLLFSLRELAALRRLRGRQAGLCPQRRRALARQLRQMGRYALSAACRHLQLCRHAGAAYPAVPAVRKSVRPAPAGLPIPPEPARGGCGACDVCLGETGAWEAARGWLGRLCLRLWA